MTKLSIAEFQQIIRETLPVAAQYSPEIKTLEHGRAVIRLPYRKELLRPGGTIAGPVLMALADLAVYAAVLSAIGHVVLAVTTSLTINFLKKPAPAALTAEARLLKLGKRLAVAEVEIFSEGDPEMVAHATATYSIPPER
jgi:uncharacterized protein (TIGR00369 family)